MDVDATTDQMLIDFLREDSDDVLLDTSVYVHEGPHSLQTKLLSDDALEGEITVPLSPLGGSKSDEPGAPNFNTLDEPVTETLKRDLKAVAKKFLHVLYPKESKSLLKEWDLWGPLMLCISMAILLRDSASTGDDRGGPQFAEVFVIYWVGAGAVTLNIKLLGGSISIFQGVCVLGYCVLPLVGSSFLCRIVLLASDGSFVFVTRGLVVLAGLVWSVFASTAFLVECQPPKRKPLAIYPVFLFYFFISWIILSSK